MTDTKEQVLSFIEKCEEIKKCKFIMATTRIKDLLKCIVNCSELYRLFETVTKGFDYPAAKRQFLITSNDGIFSNSCVVLPEKVGVRLAFIFCLLVEFDRDSLNFNDFLRTYYAEDGSYFASYQAFCKHIIEGLQSAVMQVFEAKLAEEKPDVKPNSRMAELLTMLGLLISNEIQFISERTISSEDRESGEKILSQLAEAIISKDKETIDALMCGYNYFVLYNKCVSDSTEELVRTVAVYLREI